MHLDTASSLYQHYRKFVSTLPQLTRIGLIDVYTLPYSCHKPA
ncbi:hypothetical protein AYI69_g350, partial [Smittium culicis]